VAQRNRLRWYGHVSRKDDDDWVKNVLPWRLREPDKEEGPGKHGKIVDKDMNYLHIKLGDAMGRRNWRDMFRGNWSDSKSDSDGDV